jgi:tetratricopeptide (TPR) repeat protein
MSAMRMVAVSRAWMVLLLIALTTAAPAVFPAPPKSRAEALAALKSADAATRGEAVVWLANLGTMADAPLLEARLRDESEFVRGFAEQGLWLLWGRSGRPEIDRIMAQGVEAMQHDHREVEAIALFTEVIESHPAFAEGWNKRATAYFLLGEYAKSIADCDEVLKRNPRHFGALSGLGEIYLQLREPEQALHWFRRALEVNPNLLGVEMRIRQLEEQLGETST